MKQKKSNTRILVLLTLLVCSIILNFIQGDFIDSLIKQIKDLEYSQSVIPYHYGDTENEEEVVYGEE
ncbi:hypothetical protein [Bacteroides caccae]|uniref:hypothetical protein n=1 Tax=Bacteroides caccae TaxID=47678 RepID=UPI00356AB4FF